MAARDGQDCFVCRLFRAFAFSGLGAMLAGYGALWLGATRQDAALWAVGGAVFAVLYMRGRASGPRDAGRRR